MEACNFAAMTRNIGSLSDNAFNKPALPTNYVIIINGARIKLTSAQFYQMIEEQALMACNFK